MVKIIQRSIISRASTVQRVRGIKSRICSNKSTKKKKFPKRIISPRSMDINYYLQPKIDFLLSNEANKLVKLLTQENSEFSEEDPDEVKKYKQEHRALAIIGLKDIICQVIVLTKGQLKLPGNFIFSVMALFELYLYKTEKDLSKNETINALFSCLYLVDQFVNIQVFTISFFQKTINPNFELDFDILNTVDLNLFPIKIYDYFDVFYLRISQEKKKDKNYQNYIQKFKNIFIEFNFYFAFHEVSKVKKPSINFISCLIMTYTLIQNKYSQKYEIVESYISYYKNILIYDEQEYLFSREFIKESKKVYDDLANKLNVNKSTKEGLIDNININCI